jgi:hypothetical protein
VIRKLAFLLACWLPALALAQAREFPPRDEPALLGPYVGALIGRSEAKNGCVGVVGGGGRACDKTALALGIFAGYRMSRYFGGEIAYNHLGDVEARNQGPGTSATQSLSASMFDVTGVGFLPLIGQGGVGLSALARLGLYRATLDTTVPGAGESTNWGVTYSGGLQWDADRRWGVRASWQRYKRVGREPFGNNNYDVLGVSGLWRF